PPRDGLAGRLSRAYRAHLLPLKIPRSLQRSRKRSRQKHHDRSRRPTKPVAPRSRSGRIASVTLTAGCHLRKHRKTREENMRALRASTVSRSVPAAMLGAWVAVGAPASAHANVITDWNEKAGAVVTPMA